MVSAGSLISVNGKLSPPGEAMLPLPDDGLFRGDGVFEVVRIYGGHPFALGEHLERMERSAAVIELELDRAALEAEAGSLLDRCGKADCVIRLIATRQGNRIGSVEPLPERGRSITLASVTCSPTVIMNGVKSLSYALNMQATRMAAAAGAEEALLVSPEGVVLEAPTSSLFWAAPDGRLRTTALGAGILDSITRRKLVERLDVEEGEFRLEQVLAADEAFIASTTREVQPVTSIDGHGMEPDGPSTLAAKEAFTLALLEDGVPAERRMPDRP